MNRARWPEAAETVREMVTAGTLKPGDLTPTAVDLSALTGASAQTCRKALMIMVRTGELAPPVSRSGRPRVPGGGPGPGERELSAALVAAREAAGLTQEELARRAGLSVSTARLAETGRFEHQLPATWAAFDRAAGAGGKLARMHADWQAAASLTLAGRP